MKLVLPVMLIGYSKSILQNNPNLTAGLPVKNSPFVVRGGGAHVTDGGKLVRTGKK